MMGHREALKGGGEVDALLRCKRWHHWRSGVRQAFKRKYNKRQRRDAKAAIGRVK
jgi:hypothetical protein